MGLRRRGGLFSARALLSQAPCTSAMVCQITRRMPPRTLSILISQKTSEKTIDQEQHTELDLPDRQEEGALSFSPAAPPQQSLGSRDPPTMPFPMVDDVHGRTSAHPPPPPAPPTPPAPPRPAPPAAPPSSGPLALFPRRTLALVRAAGVVLAKNAPGMAPMAASCVLSRIHGASILDLSSGLIHGSFSARSLTSHL